MQNTELEQTTFCPNCGKSIIPDKVSRGSTGWIFFWLIIFWPVFIFYFMFAYGYKYICPLCQYEIKSDKNTGIIIMGSLILFLTFFLALAINK